MGANTLQFGDAEFEASVLKSEIPVLVDFWAEWCAPCRTLAPTVDALAVENEGKVKIGKVNVDQNPKTATTYGIRSIPTILLFKGGKVVQQVVGVKTKAEIQSIINSHL
jgi:thioredoxin 1